MNGTDEFEQLNDYELIYLCRKHEPHAFSLLEKKYTPLICSLYFRKMQGYPGFDVRDWQALCQEELSRAVHRYRFDADCSFSTYLCSILTYLSNSQIRRLCRREAAELVDLSLFEQASDFSEDYFSRSAADQKAVSESDILQGISYRLLLEKMARNLSREEIRIVRLGILGYNQREIESLTGYSRKRQLRILSKCRAFRDQVDTE